jgi:hypothetical protein
MGSGLAEGEGEVGDPCAAVISVEAELERVFLERDMR